MQEEPLEKRLQAKPPATFNEENFGVDDFTFTPVSRGLGFHQEENPTKSMRRMAANKRLSSPVRPRGRQDLSKPLPQMGLGRSENFLGLSSTKVEKNFKSAKKFEEVKRSEQFFAYMIDLICLFSFSFVLVSSSLIASGMSLVILSKSPLSLVVFKMYICFFVLSYIAYFTILDAKVTVGKSIFDLRLVKKNGKDVNLSESLLRGLTSFVGLFFLGLPQLIGVFDNVSETKVVKI